MSGDKDAFYFFLLLYWPEYLDLPLWEQGPHDCATTSILSLKISHSKSFKIIKKIETRKMLNRKGFDVLIAF